MKHHNDRLEIAPHNSCRKALACALLLICGQAQAVDRIQLGLDDIHADHWSAEGISMHINIRNNGADSHISIDRLKLPEPVGELTGLTITCPTLDMNNAIISCQLSRFHVEQSTLLDNQDFVGAFTYSTRQRNLEISASEIPVAEGRLSLSGHYSRGQWQLDVKGRSLQVNKVLKYAGHLDLNPAMISGEGSVDADLAIRGRSDQPSSIEGSLKGARLNVASSNGEIASDSLSATLKMKLHRDGNDQWQGDLSLVAGQGQVYLEPLFADLTGHDLKLTSQISWQPETRLLDITDLSINQHEALALNGDATLLLTGEQTAIQSLVAEIDHLVLPYSYNSYIQPYLIGTVADSLDTSGTLQGNLEIQDDRLIRIRLGLQDLSITDRNSRFGIDDGQGNLYWTETGGSSRQSKLSWQSANLFAIDIGPAALGFIMHSNNFSLAGPSRVPVMDGAIQLDVLSLNNIGQQNMTARLDGTLEPVGLPQLTRALGWPEFDGTLSGHLPSLDYRDGVMNISGALKARVFDGSVNLNNLVLKNPFGSLPVLHSDIRMRNLDLKQVTSAFSFGRIEGRINADVDHLRLLAWKPVRFDARIYSPPDSGLFGRNQKKDESGVLLLDDKPHKISQRAIENISDIGGSGAAGLFSRGILRFFDDFAYDRIGLNCRLEGDICHMSGMASKGAGYYIVRGKRLPRIDIIGYTHEVSWPALVGQLDTITAAQTPMVK